MKLPTDCEVSKSVSDDEKYCVVPLKSLATPLIWRTDPPETLPTELLSVRSFKLEVESRAFPLASLSSKEATRVDCRDMTYYNPSFAGACKIAALTLDTLVSTESLEYKLSNSLKASIAAVLASA
jgi:hypothetical protein